MITFDRLKTAVAMLLPCCCFSLASSSRSSCRPPLSSSSICSAADCSTLYRVIIRFTMNERDKDQPWQPAAKDRTRNSPSCVERVILVLQARNSEQKHSLHQALFNCHVQALSVLVPSTIVLPLQHSAKFQSTHRSALLSSSRALSAVISN